MYVDKELNLQQTKDTNHLKPIEPQFHCVKTEAISLLFVFQVLVKEKEIW